MNEFEESNYILDEQVGFLLRLAGQRHALLFHELAPHGMTPTQFSALIRLAELKECSQNELGRRTAMDVATIKGVVDRLRKKGFVKMRSDPNDKRRALLSIEDAYSDLERTLHTAGQKISSETLSPLSSDEQNIFLPLLKKISGH